MENEDLMTVFINHAAELEKQARQMRAKYVFGSEPIQQKFEYDAKLWAYWKRIGVKA